MRDFAYHRPTSLDEARRLAAEKGAFLIAGGQTLLRDMKLGLYTPASLVDITGLISSQIELRDGAISIGAGATHADVAASPVVRQHLRVLTELVEHIGDPAVRNRGTLGGAIAANEPAGDYPAACLALDAIVHTTERKVGSAEFFVGNCRTVLKPGEIVEAVTFPMPTRAAYIKFLNPAARYAMVGVFAAVAADGSPRVSLTGVRAEGAFRWTEAEKALSTDFREAELRDIRLPLDGLIKDLFADAEYRGHLAGVVARRAIGLAAGPAPLVVALSHGSRIGTDLFR